MSRLAIVILNWNGRKLLEQFLPSVVEHSRLPGVEIYVADNGSTDGSPAWVRSNFPEVKIIENKENLGYAEGYNVALKQIDATVYCLLNSDVEAAQGWIEPVLEMMEKDPGIAACQPKILAQKQKDTFEYAGASGGLIDKWGYPFCRGRLFDHCEKDAGQYDQPMEIFWATGACLFVRKNAFEEAGGLDKHFFAHMEEIDLCWRMKRLGYKLMVEPKAVVYHLGAGTLRQDNPRKLFLNFHNNLAMLAKNLPTGKFLLVFMVRNALDDFAFLNEILQGKWRMAWSVMKAQIIFMFTFRRWRREYRLFEKKKGASVAENSAGIYRRSVVWDYFVKKRRRFSDLDYK